ncbi:GNAT family N-acetyltransferase [Actinomadura madurae]|uniref:GNAT family N-acetyltransferase n=1 Tax=Actinomadura madurae TaxID=1993 RepID=UPI0020270BDA|nr:GNAT family protein [Actinomadura madurae]MCP9950712.1 GNAT family N-acetyltransferase [Actinomadura madurae]MCP9967489.1 GNAT family N-acetyltransferase [Actinomadura madurae]MCP9979941.1 GNAT family N-acetyltransferase [Actinomadura madurae]MCQ0008528.1 GNAT family N-acetyltransferase [Actinomadura madurae]MCQ0016153.1 GNAT family N-acetyltransferase [Actinomadura madurae]
MSDEWFERPVLTGRYVRLEPLSDEHAEGLFAASQDPAVWTWLSERRPTTVAQMRVLVGKALAACERGLRLPWAQIDVSTGKVAGTTSYYEIVPSHRGLCIGHTWLGSRWHRTAVNTEAKLLLMGRAFDDLGAMRVGWHTHVRNARSRAAIERLGASFEGVHRKHRILADGSVRDTAAYAMTDDDWPAAAARLRARLR